MCFVLFCSKDSCKHPCEKRAQFSYFCLHWSCLAVFLETRLLPLCFIPYIAFPLQEAEYGLRQCNFFFTSKAETGLQPGTKLRKLIAQFCGSLTY
ncbi:hypothetical protein M426DRAFT_150197 [Hypoxylon sp. CI-4A]|nr:hypothetical protein M426DRAFT_150197 [Hypoxylon sp. CI-4A]